MKKTTKSSIAKTRIEPYFKNTIREELLIPRRKVPGQLETIVDIEGVVAVTQQVLVHRNSIGSLADQIVRSWGFDEEVSLADMTPQPVNSVDSRRVIRDAVMNHVATLIGVSSTKNGKTFNNRQFYKFTELVMDIRINKAGAEFFWMFDSSKGVYVNGMKPLLHFTRALLKAVDYTPSETQDKQILADQLAFAQALADEFAMDEEWLAIKGGHLNMNTGVVESISAKHLVSRYVPVRLDVDEPTPAYDKFKATSFPDDEETQRTIDMRIGSVLAPYLYQVVHVDWSSGRSGKGVLSSLIQQTLGSQTTGVPLSKLSGRFALGAFLDRNTRQLKLANLGPEDKSSNNDGRLYISGENLKLYSGGESIIGTELKGIDYFNVMFRGIFQQYSYNTFPVFPNEFAIRDRLRITHWPMKFTGANRDIHLLDKLLAERDAIFTKAYREFRKWVDEGHSNFPESANQKKVKAELFNTDTRNIVEKFLDSGALVNKPGDSITKADFIERLEAFAIANGESSATYRNRRLWSAYRAHGKYNYNPKNNNNVAMLYDVAWGEEKEKTNDIED